MAAKSYTIKPADGTAEFTIDADRYEFDTDSGRHLFWVDSGDTGVLVGNLLNVSVVQQPVT